MRSPIATLTDIPRNGLVRQNMLQKYKIRVTISDHAVGQTIATSPSVAAHSFTQLNGVYYKNPIPEIRYLNRLLTMVCCATNRKVVGSIPAGVSGFFIDIKSFRSHYGPGVDSASNRNEYQEYFLGVKGGRYNHPVPLSRNLGTLTSWNPQGPFGPVTGLLYLLLTMVEGGARGGAVD